MLSSLPMNGKLCKLTTYFDVVVLEISNSSECKRF